jgi:hypothetical protein
MKSYRGLGEPAAEEAVTGLPVSGSFTGPTSAAEGRQDVRRGEGPRPGIIVPLAGADVVLAPDPRRVPIR